MKNLLIGIIIGMGLTLLGVWGYSSFFDSGVKGKYQSNQVKFADRKIENKPYLQEGNSETLKKASAEKDLKKHERQVKDGKRDSSEDSIRDMLKGSQDVSSEVQSFSGMMNKGRSSWQELAQEIKALKDQGNEGIAELLKIIEGEGSDFFKMIAAGVLGEVYSDTQDPEVMTTLENRVLPLIQSILDSGSNMRLKNQAVNTLGELGIQKAQDMLMDILLDDTNQWLQLTSMRVLREKGSLEAASQLVEMLQSSQDVSHIMLAAGTLGKMNDRLNDPLISQAIGASVPKLKRIIEDENQTFQTKRNALMTLGTLGTTESIESLIKVTEEQAGRDSALERMAVWSLIRNGNGETAESLGSRLSGSNNDDVKILFASAIGGMANMNQDPTAQSLAQSLALPTLKNISLSGKSIDIRKKAIQAMGSVGNTRDIDFLQQIALNSGELQPTANQAIRQIQKRGSNQDRWPMGRFMRPGF